VVAAELARNPDVSVLLLEAGATDEIATVSDPDQWLANLGADTDWGFSAAPNVNLNGRAIPYSMGKVLGGGGSINVAVWSRGHKADWDHFAEVSGDSGWAYDAVLELYRKIESYQASPSEIEGSGPMWIRPAQDRHPFYDAVLESMTAQGIQRFDRQSGPLWEAPHGCSYVDETIRGSQRQSPFRSYIGPQLGRPNLTISTGAVVLRVLMDQARAVGVEFIQHGQVRRVYARTEVILSLGAINTPKILMLSGIGDEAKLKPFGISVIQHLPGVGSQLHDHIALGCSWQAGAAEMPVQPRGQAVCFWKTDLSQQLPNALAFAIPIIYATPENSRKFSLPSRGWSLFAGMAPQSRGELSLTGSDPLAPPCIQTNFLSQPEDLRSALRLVEMCRAIGNDAALGRYRADEIMPGALTGEALEHYVRDGIGTFWHQSGGAQMGTDERAVVDGQLKVRGIDALRVADASVMPRVTVGNTMAPCVVIGARAADLIKAEHGL